MTIWEWIQDFEHLAELRGDRERIYLARIHSEAYQHRQEDPDRMLARLTEGRSLALRLEEPWWVAFFDHWIVETYIYYKDDYRDIIDQAVRLTLETRKPMYDGYPLRFAIWCNLVAAYLCVDPVGYQEQVREAIAYLGAQVPPEGSDRYLYQARRHWFAYETGRFDEAHQLALEELTMAQTDPDRYTGRHHEVDTYKALCWIAYRRGDWECLEECATVGEERARAIQYRYELALFLLWRAACARRTHREEESRGWFRQGVAQMARLGQLPSESYFDAVAEYHTLGENLQAAWKTRERELEVIRDRGQLAYECQVRVKRVLLLRQMGQPTADEERAAHEAASRLRAPEFYLRRLREA
ncbi:MAG: hypothetical protein U0840_03835 [Gemmataceae bacterium]